MSPTADLVLHVSPHPDDETLGCGPTLSLLAEAGCRVVNLACGLGRPDDHERREAELRDATARWGFNCEILRPPGQISAADDLDLARVLLVEQLREVIDRLAPAVLVSPQVHDLHHGHEVVARAVLSTLTGLENGPRWWMWGLWADLAAPTLYVPFGQDTLDRQLDALAAYPGETSRNDYPALARARATAHAVLGTERVFGYGSGRRSELPYADLLTELRFHAGGWRLGNPRMLDPSRPMASCSQQDVSHWLHARSLRP
jgi:LmbE family N-acetylglucosaminyl deacetylase